MKKTITLLLFAVFCMVGTTNAQKAQSTNIQDLVERLAQIGDSHAAISDYFTQEEQNALRAHLANRIPAPHDRPINLVDTSIYGESTMVGTAVGESVFNGPAGTATRAKYGDQNRTPVVITHSITQTIEAGAEIACAGASYRDNSIYRAFDLTNDFGIAGDFDVTNGEIAIGAGVITPAGFPMTVNIWHSTGAAFPDGTLTLMATDVATIMVADSETLLSFAVPTTIPAGGEMILEAMIVDDLSDTNFMRFGANNDGQTAPSWILAPDCGATVISDLLLAFGLANSFVMNVVGDEATTGGGGLAYCAMNSSNEFGSFDPTDGTVVTPINNSPAAGFENAGSIDPNDSTTAYVLDNLGDAYSVDIATGVYTALGNIPGDWLGAEFDPTSGIYYALAADLNLYTVDFGGLSASLVGPTGAAGFPIALAIDAAGVAYTYDVVDDNMYTVDLGTGAITLLGNIGFDANFGQGMGYDPGTDTVYLTAFNSGGPFDSELRILDTGTGNTTLVNQMEIAGLTQYAWVSFESAPVVGPPNDDCVDAIDVNCGDVVVGETNTASDTGGNAAPDLWYSFTGMGVMQDVTLSFCDGGTDYDSFVRVFDACGGTEIAANDDFCGLQSELTFTSDGTATYWIMVEGFGSNSGNFSMVVSCIPDDPTGPLNDDCVDAIAVACDDVVAGSTIDATDSGSNAAPDVWYSFTGTGSPQDVTLSFCDGGTDYDSYVRVFDACGGTEIAENDDSCGLQSELTFLSDGTSTYWIMVEGFGSNVGNFSMAVTCDDLGIGDIDFAEFNYYPNPANESINFSAQENIDRVAIYNILGQKVLDQSVNAISGQLNVADLQTGTYIMEVTVGSKTGTYKVIKR